MEKKEIKRQRTRRRNYTVEELEKKRQHARELFLYTQKPQQEIANIVDVSPSTLTRWKTVDGWEGEKARMASTATKQQQIYFNLVDKIEKMTSKTEDEGEWDFDALAKTVAALERFERKRNVSSHIEQVGLLLAKYLSEEMPDERTRYIEFYRDFAQWYLKTLAPA